jgi:hypothetical protein
MPCSQHFIAARVDRHALDFLIGFGGTVPGLARSVNQ